MHKYVCPTHFPPVFPVNVFLIIHFFKNSHEMESKVVSVICQLPSYKTLCYALFNKQSACTLHIKNHGILSEN